MPKRFVTYFFLLAVLVQHDVLFSQNSDSSLSEIKGKVLQSLSFHSKLAGGDLKYSVYLPREYGTPGKRFPVLYFLHGLGGDETSWIIDFSIHHVVDSLTEAGDMLPVIIIMPDGRKSYYINDVYNRFPYEDIFINEFVPFIDSTYSTINHREFRVLGGLSMGGYGAVVNCMNHPGTFSAAIAFSAAIRTDSMIINEKSDKYNQCFRPIYGDSLMGKCRLTHHWILNNPLYLVKAQPEVLTGISWYLDCGLSDYLLPGNEALHDLFVRYRIPHEFHVRAGGHERIYWKSGLVPALQFANHFFRNQNPGH